MRFKAALRAATTTCGGFSWGPMLDSILERAPAAWRGVKKAKPPAEI